MLIHTYIPLTLTETAAGAYAGIGLRPSPAGRATIANLHTQDKGAEATG